MSELNSLLQRLSDAGIEFVVVGGVAAVLHGSSMVTRDLDVCAPLSGTTLEKLREALSDLHPVHRIATSGTSFLENPRRVFQCRTCTCKPTWVRSICLAASLA